MRLLSTEVRGLLAIKEARIDYSQLGQVVALVGVNGAGKTTLLESPVAALYRKLASRSDNVADVAKGRDAYIESVFQDGDGTEWRARISIDAERRKVEQHLLRAGKPVTTGKADEVAKAVRKAFGSLDALLASVFCAQERNGEFTTLGKAERKALLVEALGLGKLQERCEAARERARSFETDIATLSRQVEAREAQQAHLEQAETDLAEGRTAAALAELAHEAARHAVEEEQEAYATLNGQMAASERAEAALKRARQIEREAALRVERATIRVQQVEREVDQRAAKLKYRRENLATKVDTPIEAPRATEALELVVAEDEAQIATLSKLVETHRRAWSELERSVAAASEKLAQARAAEAAEAARRAGLATQAALLDRVPCTDSDEWAAATDPALAGRMLSATCPLLEHARKAHKSLSVPAPASEIQVLEEAVVKVAKQRQEAEADGRSAVDHRAAAEANLRTHTADLNLVRAHNATVAEAARAQAQARIDLEALDAEEALSTDVESLEGAAADRLQAEVEHRNALEASGEASREATKLAVAPGALERTQRNIEAAKDCATRAQQDLRAADSRIAAAQALAEKLRADLEATAGAPEELRQAQDEQQDWQVLAEALGRDGIQALEIDAAGPGIAELCNELLASCYGPRFSLRFETLRQNKTTDGAQEVFDIVALDNGEERRLEALSGGEKVIVREALALALAIWNARRSGVRWRTIFRDETAGALSEFNALAYVTMLRRACELGGFVQVIFISHQREVTARADSIVLVEDGTARVA